MISSTTTELVVQVVTPEIIRPLDQVERAELADAAYKVRRFEEAFREACMAVRKVQEGKLYREHGTFEAWLDATWNKDRSFGYRMVRAAGVHAALALLPPGMVIMPEGEYATRQLGFQEPETIQSVYVEAQRRAPAGKPPSAKLLGQVLLEQRGDSDDQIRRDHARALLTGSGSVEYYTPAHVAAAVRQLLGVIDWDPASCLMANKVIGAVGYWTAVDDGFGRPWGRRVFLNPPYGKDEQNESNQARWSANLAARIADPEAQEEEAVLLVNGYTGNRWFQPLLDQVICLPPRLSFWSPEKPEGEDPTHSSALIYFGQRPEAFAGIFDEQVGPVVRRWRP